MSWILAIITIICMELTIKKIWWAWVLTLLNQVFWFYYLTSTSQWGLLLLNAAMIVQAIRGIRAWRKGPTDEKCSCEQNDSD